MTNSALEFLARIYGNVVRYDAQGNPSLFVRFPKMKSIELDASLPDHTHPAFIINGIEQDEILIGKYAGTTMDGTTSGRIYSLPNMPPVHSRTADQMLAQCRTACKGASGMTVADRGFLLLLAQKNGWNPRGNTDKGHCRDDVTSFRTGEKVSLGAKRGYDGWLYECNQEHMTDAELAPNIAPKYWQKIRQIGGSEAYPDIRDDGMTLTLNGTGPLGWYLDGRAGSVADLVGNVQEVDYGCRIIDNELQILENNNAADPEADLTIASAAWKAILPNPTDDGYTLVAPGTNGTVHLVQKNGVLLFDTMKSEYTNTVYTRSFAELEGNLPYIPHILKELGLFPCTGSCIKGKCSAAITAKDCMLTRGGDYTSCENAGMGCLDYTSEVGTGNARIGVRLRCMA